MFKEFRDLLGALHLPSWVLHTTLAVCTLALGYTIAEVKAKRVVDDARVQRLIASDYPRLQSEVAVLQVQVAALDGTQRRMETKVDRVAEQMETVSRAVARLEGKLDRVLR